MEKKSDVYRRVIPPELSAYEVKFHSSDKHNFISCPAEGGTQPL